MSEMASAGRGPATARDRCEPAVGRPAVVLLRALGLGDFLTGLPAYRAVRRAFPEHEIVLAAPAVLAPLVALTGAIDRLLPVGELQPVSWAGPSPAVAADLHGNGPASHRLVEALGAGLTMMYASPAAPLARGPWWCEDEHEVARWCRLVRWYGIPADPGVLADLRLRAPAGTTKSPGVVIHPGAASASRRWPADRFAAVAAGLSAKGLPVRLTGSAAEKPLCDRIAWRAGLDQGTVTAGTTGLAGLARLIAGAAAVISNDTGPAHLAVAFGTPSVSLFGPVSPALWGPPARPEHIAIWKGTGGRPGDAHGREPDPRLLSITVPEVLAAVGSLLAPARPVQPGTAAPPVLRAER